MRKNEYLEKKWDYYDFATEIQDIVEEAGSPQNENNFTAAKEALRKIWDIGEAIQKKYISIVKKQ